MSFQKFYGLSPQLHESILAKTPECMDRSPDADRAEKWIPTIEGEETVGE